MRFFLKCNEAARVCDKCQYDEAGIFEKLILKIHLRMCKICRTYSAHNEKLTKTIESANLKSLCEEDKALLKKRLRQEIKNGKQD